jgi:molybdenum cofactor cytidylyltransferase
MQNMKDNIAIIILAAGGSSRLDKPKQLVRHQGRTLVSHVTAEAFNAGLLPVLVVTGAGSETIAKELDETNAEIVYNDRWQEGVASSIVKGITHLMDNYAGAEDVIVAVCDQPFVSEELFMQLMDAKKTTGKGIVGSAYAGTVGTPVLFDQSYFRDLAALQGDQGAKKLLKMYADDMTTVPFEQGEVDIDTQDDLNRLHKETNQS